MRIPGFLYDYFYRKAVKAMENPVDERIGGTFDDPYMLRWCVRKTKWLTHYVHLFQHSDDDRALHDHPAHSISIILIGSYREHFKGERVKRRLERHIYFRRATTAHRIEIPPSYIVDHFEPVVTYFIMGRRHREWGFHCPNGWRHWKNYTQDVVGSSVIGKGCE